MDTTRQHLTDEELEAYSRWQLPVERLIAADEHLASCDLCFSWSRGDEELESFAMSVRDNLREAGALNCLSFEQIAGFVNGKRIAPHDRQYIEDHLELCRECRDLAHEFRGIRRQIESSSTSATEKPKSLRGKVGAFLQSRPALYVVQASLAVGIIVVLLVTVIPLRRRTGELQQQIAALQRESAEMREREAAKAKETQEQIALLKDELDATLRGGRSMVTASGSAVVLRDGGREVTLDESGKLSGLESVPAAYHKLVREALRFQRIRFVPVQLPRTERPGPRLGVSDEGETFRLLEPLRTVVLSDRPTFRWEKLEGAESYVVFVRKLGSDSEVESEPTTETQWTPRAPLKRGHAYVWAVEALKGGRRVYAFQANGSEAEFAILDEASVGMLSQAKIMSGGSHLIMALLYAKHGLATEAELELQTLLGENRRSKLIETLIKNFRSARKL
ncbi:MAG TPA: hypothetical protein VFV34_12255 [Blastocatellia bacterium]|nr:hypothetical protein [Blastocatellia bacterium]